VEAERLRVAWRPAAEKVDGEVVGEEALAREVEVVGPARAKPADQLTKLR
jgi:hypothetical protein